MPPSQKSLSHLSVTQRLAEVNLALEEHGLAKLAGLGDNARGWSEILDIERWEKHPSGLWHDITFIVRRVCGKTYTHTVRFNANSKCAQGVILLPVIGGEVIIIKQFRVAVGCETWELARGFAEHKGDYGAEITALPPALVRELGEEVMEHASIVSVQPIGTIFENTGTHHTSLDVSIVTLAPPANGSLTSIRGSQGFPVKLVSWADLYHPLRLGIRDAHSLAAIALAREYLEK